MHIFFELSFERKVQIRKYYKYWKILKPLINMAIIFLMCDKLKPDLRTDFNFSAYRSGKDYTNSSDFLYVQSYLQDAPVYQNTGIEGFYLIIEQIDTF